MTRYANPIARLLGFLLVDCEPAWVVNAKARIAERRIRQMFNEPPIDPMTCRFILFGDPATDEPLTVQRSRKANPRTPAETDLLAPSQDRGHD